MSKAPSKKTMSKAPSKETMSKAPSKLQSVLLYSTVVHANEGHISNQINEDNRKAAVIWSLVEAAFWVFCLILSIGDSAFATCRSMFAVAFALSAVTFGLAAFVAPKFPALTRPLVIVMYLVLLCDGIGLVFFQPDTRSATFIAAVLIVPVMFVCDTLPVMACVAISVVCFAVTGSTAVTPEVYSWTLKSLVIFSIAGILIGNVINKSRLERYSFAESAFELAELRKKYAYYDQLTELPNRRAFTEKIEQLAAGNPPVCSVVVADINGLKKVNDTYGHNAGDELITGAAECLSRCFVGAGDVYRLGGDEFCIIATEAEDDVEKRLQHADRMAACWNGELVEGLSISHGVAAVREGAGIKSALEAADRKMYEHKRRYYATAGRA